MSDQRKKTSDLNGTQHTGIVLVCFLSLLARSSDLFVLDHRKSNLEERNKRNFKCAQSQQPNKRQNVKITTGNQTVKTIQDLKLVPLAKGKSDWSGKSAICLGTKEETFPANSPPPCPSFHRYCTEPAPVLRGPAPPAILQNQQQGSLMSRYWKAWVWPHSNHTGNHNLVQTNLLVHTQAILARPHLVYSTGLEFWEDREVLAFEAIIVCRILPYCI